MVRLSLDEDWPLMPSVRKRHPRELRGLSLEGPEGGSRVTGEGGRMLQRELGRMRRPGGTKRLKPLETHPLRANEVRGRGLRKEAGSPPSGLTSKAASPAGLGPVKKVRSW